MSQGTSAGPDDATVIVNGRAREPAATTPHYPELWSTDLRQVPWRLLRRRSRSRDEFPSQPPGSVLVFQLPDRFAASPEGKLDLTSPELVDAVSVACVTLRRQLVYCSMPVPSATPESRFVINVSFLCAVTDAVMALREGNWDIRPALLTYILACPKLMLVGARRKSNELNDVELRVIAMMTKYQEMKPPHISGFDVKLAEVWVGLAQVGRPDASAPADDVAVYTNDDQAGSQ